MHFKLLEAIRGNTKRRRRSTITLLKKEERVNLRLFLFLETTLLYALGIYIGVEKKRKIPCGFTKKKKRVHILLQNRLEDKYKKKSNKYPSKKAN